MSSQLVQDAYKGNGNFRDVWSQSNVDIDALKTYLDKNKEKLVNLGDDPFDPETLEKQSLARMLGDVYAQSEMYTDYTGEEVGADMRVGSPYSDIGYWSRNFSNITPTVNLSGDQSFEGWRDKSIPLMETIEVFGEKSQDADNLIASLINKIKQRRK